VGRQLGRLSADERLGVESRRAGTETVVVDYSAPNLAKEMHVGHLRSTIIGDALVRMLDFAGHTVIRQNHVGDWGTQFGMLIAYFDLISQEHEAETEDAGRIPGPVIIKDLEEFYRLAKQKFDSDPEFAAYARQCVVRLQGGEPAILKRWELVWSQSLFHCDQVYKRLGVHFENEDFRGESAYNDVLPDIVKALRKKKLLTESQGAQCVFLRNPQGEPFFKTKEGDPLPLIIQKSDEGYLYATTDLAALAFRTGALPQIRNPKSEIRNENSPHADRILYVVDARQSLHFRMLFECAYQAKFAKRGKHELIHVAFGTMMGPDGRPFKTREGGTVKLMDLLDEAEKRALDLVTQKNAEDVAAGRTQPLSDEQKKDIAHKVGIGAVKYADLAQNRTSDYVFSWEKMLSLAGNTAPYMQYAYARVRSIFRKGGEEAETHRADSGPIPLAAPEELALGKILLRFPEALERALEGYQPNVLAAYLYDLAQAFTAFYEACPVLKSPGAPGVRQARLRLCDLVARTIAKGLDLLGIEVADRM